MSSSQPKSKPFVRMGDQLPDFLRSFWQRQINTAEDETPDYRHPSLPLARIKKVMKSDPEVKVSTIVGYYLPVCKVRLTFILKNR